MRFPVGTIYNVLLPVGPIAPAGGESAPIPLTRQTADVLVAANPQFAAPASAPVMSSGGTGTYPFLSPNTSVPGVPSVPTPVQTPYLTAQQIVTSRPSADKNAHETALRQATNARIAAGESPIDAALNAQQDTARFYSKLTAMSEDQRQQFYKFSQALADQSGAQKQLAVNQKLADMTQANVAAGMSPAAAKAKADSEATQFFSKLATATPEELANFKRMTEQLAKNEADAKAKAAATAAAEAARKVESDRLKNQAAAIVRNRRVSQPITRSSLFRR